MNPKRPLELYVHIPFCVRKCLYCDFLSFPIQDDAKSGDTAAISKNVCDSYMQALLQEIEYAPEMVDITQSEVQSIFIGGGTPSIIDGVYINEILCKLRSFFAFSKDPEITIEANPGTLTVEKLHVYQEAGINRLSIGLQSTDHEELKRLGRIHTYETFLESYILARREGFYNINIDLMTALPGQTMENLTKTLQRVIALRPEHISAYSLIIEEHTPYASLYTEEDLPDEDLDREMYAETGRILAEAGYHRYEISNYAREGYTCRHNSGYWKRTPYLGFGLGASSLYHETRWKNEEKLSSYIEQIARLRRPERYEEQKLTEQMQMEEFLFLGLRMTDGILYETFRHTFGRSLDELYGTKIDLMVQKGLLEKTGADGPKGVKLTRKGLDLSNYVFSCLM